MKPNVLKIGLALGLLTAMGLMIAACSNPEPAPAKTAEVSTQAPQTTTLTKNSIFFERPDPRDHWVYDATNKHDPFVMPDPLEARLKEGSFDVDQMVLYGVVRGANRDRAFVKLPNGDDLIVKLDDRLGRHGGVVREIGPDYITVREQFIDGCLDKDYFIDKQPPLVVVKNN